MNLHVRLYSFMLLILGLTAFSSIAQPISQEYSFLVTNGNGSAVIMLVNPSTTQTRPLLIIPPQFGKGIGSGFLSSTGQWIVLHNYGQGTESLTLFNLVSKQSILVLDNIRFPMRPNSLGGDFPVFAWSPDGQYFAFHYETALEYQSTYLYTISSSRLLELGSLATNQYQLSWSPDSTQLAVVSMRCDEQECSRSAIDIFASNTGQLNSTVNLQSFAGSGGIQATNFCQINWSPDNTRLAFLDFCDSSGIGSPREVQILDIETLTINQATSLTPTDIDPASSLFRAEIDMNWISADVLLIGVSSVEGKLFFGTNGNITASDESESQYTMSFKTSTGLHNKIDQIRRSEWSPTSNHQFGYLAYEYTTSPDRGTRITDATVEIAAFDGQALVPLATGPSGCMLSWNRNADTLAYIGKDVYAVGLCEPTFDTLNFLTSTGLQSFVAVPGQQSVALGWFTPYGEPATPTPTFSPHPPQCLPLFMICS